MALIWREDLTSSSLEEIVQMENENRAWKKELKFRTNLLIEDKLAKRIGAEQYAAGRETGGALAVECSRRERMLNEEITNRRYLRRASRSRS